MVCKSGLEDILAYVDFRERIVPHIASNSEADQLGPLTNSAHTILAQLISTVWHIRKANILQKIAPNQYSHLQLHWVYRWVKFENIQFDLI
jgi:hypothetical protein